MQPKRILIVRTSALGDIVHTLPLAKALKRTFPAAQIGWVVEEHFSMLTEGFPHIDHTFKVALKRWRRKPLSLSTWREARQSLAGIRDFDADIVIDAMGNHKAGLLAALSFCDRRLGAPRRNRREPSSAMWLNEPVNLSGEHVIDQNLSIAEHLGVRTQPSDTQCRELLLKESASSPTSSSPPILIHPGAGWRNKEFPTDRWARVAESLNEATGHRIGVVFGPGEEGLAHSIQKACQVEISVLDGGDLAQLTSLFRGARLVMGGDTGPLHLAEAIGTATVCVLGPTDPGRNGAYRSHGTNVAHRLPCSFCYRRLNEAKACLLMIEAGEVAEAALAVLARPQEAG